MGFNPVKSFSKAVSGIGKQLASPQGMGMIIGAALAAPTGGMSMAWGASLGGAAGSLAGGGSIKDAAMAGAAGYGLGSLATPYLAPSAAPALGGGIAPTGSGFGGTGPQVAGGVGSLNSRVGTAALNPDVSWGVNPVGPPSQLPSDPYGLNYMDQAVATPVPAALPPAETPFWESDMMKYGIGGVMLAGMLEDPNYDTVRSPDAEPSVVDQYYADVAEHGEGNVPLPTELQPVPASRVNNFGSKRLGAKRYAQGGAVDSEAAWLTPGEFVMTKDAVKGAGGAKRMYQLMDQLEQRGAR